MSYDIDIEEMECARCETCIHDPYSNGTAESPEDGCELLAQAYRGETVVEWGRVDGVLVCSGYEAIDGSARPRCENTADMFGNLE